MSVTPSLPSTLPGKREQWLAALPGDEELRAQLELRILSRPQHYSAAEKAQLSSALEMEAEVNDSRKLRRISSATPLLNDAVRMMSKDGRHNVVKASGLVRAPIMRAAAYNFLNDQEVGRILQEEQSVNVNTILNWENDHCHILHWGMAAPPLSPRDGVYRFILQVLPNNEVIIAVETLDYPQMPPQKGVVRLFLRRLMRFSQVTPGTVMLTCTTTFDLRGSVPRFLSDSLTTPAAARAPLTTLRYFVQIKESGRIASSGQDARVLGQLLVHEMEAARTKKRPGELESQLHTFVYRTTVLREITEVHQWFPKMLFEVLRSVTSVPRKTQANLADFTERDAAVTGRAMKMLMLTNASPDAAVDEVSRANIACASASEASSSEASASTTLWQRPLSVLCTS
jgi:hypothetical protein